MDPNLELRCAKRLPMCFQLGGWGHRIRELRQQIRCAALEGCEPARSAARQPRLRSYVFDGRHTAALRLDFPSKEAICHPGRW